MKDLDIGITLRTLRIKQGRTIQEISDFCGLSKSMVSKIETNKVFPSVATLTKIAKTLGTNISSLLEENAGNQGNGAKRLGNFNRPVHEQNS